MTNDEALKKPCEYCGQDLPLGVDKPTRQVRSHHFSHCTARPEPEPVQEQEPVCPDCTAKVLYECVFCSSNNYPPKEQPEQEPVAWADIQKEAQQIVESKFLWKKFIVGTPLSNDIACWMADFAQQYTTPPQPEWVGLTDDEIDEAVNSCRTLDTRKYFRAIEAKLKEKNT